MKIIKTIWNFFILIIAASFILPIVVDPVVLNKMGGGELIIGAVILLVIARCIKPLSPFKAAKKLNHGVQKASDEIARGIVGGIADFFDPTPKVRIKRDWRDWL